MRKVIALLLLAVFVIAGCAASVKAPTDQRSIQRSNEAHKDLERSTQP